MKKKQIFNYSMLAALILWLILIVYSALCGGCKQTSKPSPTESTQENVIMEIWNDKIKVINNNSFFIRVRCVNWYQYGRNETTRELIKIDSNSSAFINKYESYFIYDPNGVNIAFFKTFNW